MGTTVEGEESICRTDPFSDHEIPSLEFLSLGSICRAMSSETLILTWKATGKGNTSHVDIVPKASVPQAGWLIDRHQPNGEEKPARSVGIAKDDPWPLLVKNLENLYSDVISPFPGCQDSIGWWILPWCKRSQSVHHSSSITCRNKSVCIPLGTLTNSTRITGLRHKSVAKTPQKIWLFLQRLQDRPGHSIYWEERKK